MLMDLSEPKFNIPDRPSKLDSCTDKLSQMLPGADYFAFSGACVWTATTATATPP